jgi:hypothetical protein
MATVYFGAYKPIVAHTGNWQALNQWYSTPGNDNSKSANYNAVFLNRFPTTADEIYFFQPVTSNVGVYNTSTQTWTTDGIWPGTVNYLMANGVGIWTGSITQYQYIDPNNVNYPFTYNQVLVGNAANTLPEIRGTYQYLHMKGGLISNTNVNGAVTMYGGRITAPFTNRLASLSVYSENVSITNPIKTSYLSLWGTANIANGIASCSSFFTYSDNVKVSSDISTANTGCLNYGIGGGTFSNTNPWIFGNTTTSVFAVTFGTGYYANNFVTNKNITIYSSFRSNDFRKVITFEAPNEGNRTNGARDMVFNGLINILPTTGNTNTGVIFVGAGTYSPNVNVYVTQVGSNTTILKNDWPKDYGFGIIGGFKPNIRIVNIPPGTDILNSQI